MRDHMKMRHENEKVADALKAARMGRGLSQRALGARTGVPQSHISRIENGGVNLTVSSLATIANALDLEVVLVPRKAVPAVRTIARGVDTAPTATPEARRAIAGIARALESIFRTLNIDHPVIESLQRRLREFRQFETLVRNTDPLRDIGEALKAIDDPSDIAALEEVSRKMDDFRNALVHGAAEGNRVRLPRPAYRPDGDIGE